MYVIFQLHTSDKTPAMQCYVVMCYAKELCVNDVNSCLTTYESTDQNDTLVTFKKITL